MANNPKNPKHLRVDVWSDVACPWCHVGKRRLEAALADFEHRGSVEVVWRAFELDPSAPEAAPAPANGLKSYADRLAKKYGSDASVAEARLRQMTETAATDGLDFRFDRIRPGNTFDAHRLIHLGGERGKQDAVKERLLRGYLEEGQAMTDHAALLRLGTEAGLDADEVQALLASDLHADDVRADEREAAELGVTGVPFFVIGRYAISGAQPKEVFARALALAWSELAPESKLTTLGDADAACGPDGCSIEDRPRVASHA